MKKQIKNFGIYALSAIVFVAVLFLSIEKNDKGEFTLKVTAASAYSGGEGGSENGGGENGTLWVRIDEDCVYQFKGQANADVYLFGIKVGKADANGEFTYEFAGGKTRCIQGGYEQCEARYCPPLDFSNTP